MTMQELHMQCEFARQIARESIVLDVLGLVVFFGAMALIAWYIADRWTWIPRKRHNRVFVEKF